MILEPDGKSFKASFLQLAKGEHQGVIKIDNIDRRNGIVTLSVNGTRRKLNFKDDAYAPAICLLYTSPSPRDQRGSRMPSSA